MKRISLGLAAAIVVFTAGVLLAQGHTGHDHAKADLGGYCPVAYVEMHKAVKGDPQVSLDFAGHHYQFVNADAKKMFEADPNKYKVAYDGYCATAVSMGKKVESDPEIFDVRGGVTYLFSSEKAKEMYDAKPDEVIAKADDQWSTLEPAYGGHCPVAYIKMNKAVMGDPKLFVDRDGERLIFVNADAKKMFEADPDKYEVAYDGYCATAMSMGKLYPSDSTIFVVKDGKTYLFSSEKAKKMFETDPDKIVAKAGKEWAALD
jgi:YHS domain-containing protein